MAENSKKGKKPAAEKMHSITTDLEDGKGLGDT